MKHVPKVQSEPNLSKGDIQNTLKTTRKECTSQHKFRNTSNNLQRKRFLPTGLTVPFYRGGNGRQRLQTLKALPPEQLKQVIDELGAQEKNKGCPVAESYETVFFFKDVEMLG